MKHIQSVAALALISVAAARADIVVFDDETSFLAAVPLAVAQDFEGVPAMDVPGVFEIDSITFVTRGFWTIPGCESVDLGANTIEPRHVTFVASDGGAGAVRALGFRLRSLASFPPADYAVAIVTADGEITQIPIEGVTFDDPAYRGFVSTTAPIARVVVVAIGTSHTNYCLDDISRTNVLGGGER